MFDKVFIGSPSLKTAKNDPFSCLPEDQIEQELTVDFTHRFEEEIKGSGEKVIFLKNPGAKAKTTTKDHAEDTPVENQSPEREQPSIGRANERASVREDEHTSIRAYEKQVSSRRADLERKCDNNNILKRRHLYRLEPTESKRNQHLVQIYS